MSRSAALQRARLWLRQGEEDLWTHSLTGLLRELGEGIEERWRVTARLLDKLYAPTRYPDALGGEAPMDVFGPEDAEAAIVAAEPLLSWVKGELDASH